MIKTENKSTFKPGDIYEDSAYHPCLCMGVDGDEIWGISLIDGTYPRTESINMSGIVKLSYEEAWYWKTKGPKDIDEDIPDKWW